VPEGVNLDLARGTYSVIPPGWAPHEVEEQDREEVEPGPVSAHSRGRVRVGDFVYVPSDTNNLKLRSSGDPLTLYTFRASDGAAVDSVVMGSNRSGFLPDSAAGTVWVCAENDDDSTGTFLSLAGGHVQKKVPFHGKSPFAFVSMAGDTAVILGNDQLSSIATRTGVETGYIPFEYAGSQIVWDSTGVVGFVNEMSGSKVTAFNRRTGEVLNTVKCGSGGKRLLKTFAAIAGTALSMAAAQVSANIQAQQFGFGSAPYQVFTVAPGLTSFCMRRDGKGLYVYCSDTRDITTISTETYIAEEPVPVGAGARMALAGDGKTLFVAHSGGVSVFDPDSNAVTAEYPTYDAGPRGFKVPVAPHLDEAHGRMWLAQLLQLTVLDLKDGSLVREIALPCQPRAILPMNY
jgi:hypothetical protein